MDTKKITASDLFFNISGEGTIEDAKVFLDTYPFFKDVFTAKDLAKDYRNRL